MEGLGRLVMIAVLDTSALWHRGLIRELAAARQAGLEETGDLRIILPTIVQAERSRQIAGHPAREGAWEQVLEAIQPTREPFGTAEAGRLGKRAPGQGIWREHARDFLIATHVHGDRVGITDDQGPAWEGLDTMGARDAARAINGMI